MKKTFLLLIVFCLTATVVFAQETPKPTEYELLAPIPLSGIDQGETKKTEAGPYIEGIFTLLIAIAGGLAVLMIIFGGIEYMSTDAFSGKSEAKKRIENAIWGLMLAIGAWLILTTVNPNLTKFDLEIQKQEVGTTTPPIVIGGCASGDCQTLASLGLSPNASGSAVGKSVDPALGARLISLNSFLRAQDITWRITEAFPPSQTHQAPCHNNGTCIDANVLPDPQTINAFINAAQRAGLRPVYEVETQEEKDNLVRGGVSNSNITVLPPINGRRQITAPHFSVYCDNCR